MGSRSTLEPEEDYGSFTDEYSVRIEVYETEVTDSGGSAPIIKISGLCNADDPVPYLIGQQSERRFAAVDQAAMCSATQVYKDQLPRFQSLQVLRTAPVAQVSPKTKLSAIEDVASLNDAAKATWESTACDAFAGDANRKRSIFSTKPIAEDTTRTEHYYEPDNCVSPQSQSREQCSVLGGRHPTESKDYGRSARSRRIEKHRKATCQTRCVPRSRQTTTIPSRLSRRLWNPPGPTAPT
ncbi:hypothetical protein MTO96_032861 [Rhipicephalus appendiculatus]